MTLMPRKTEPRARVAIRNRGTSFLWLVWADHTDMAMVKLLAISTMVLPKPSGNDSIFPPIPNAVEYAWRLIEYVRNRPPKNKISINRHAYSTAFGIGGNMLS